MYNLDEYIYIRRATEIIEALRDRTRDNTESGTYYSMFAQSDVAFKNSRDWIELNYNLTNPQLTVYLIDTITDIVQLCVPGATVKKYVSIQTDCDEETPSTCISLLMFEVFEPTHAYIPIYITDESVLIVSPFSNSFMARGSKSPYLSELFSTRLLTKYMPVTERNDWLQNNCIIDIPASEDGTQPAFSMTYAQYVYDVIQCYICGITDRDKFMVESFSGINWMQFKSVPRDSTIFNKMKTKWAVETQGYEDVTKKLDDGVISSTDFMPIELVSETGSSGLVSIVDYSDTDNTMSQTKIRLVEYNDQSEELKFSERNTLITPESRYYGERLIISLGPCYYIGHNTCVAKNTFNSDLEYMSLFDMVPVHELSSTVMSSEDALESYSVLIGTESLNPLSWIKTLKKFGIEKGTKLYSMLYPIFKLPPKYIKKVGSAVFGGLRKANELEKEESLDIQEKMLNDELDKATERLRLYAQISVRTLGVLFILGNIWIGLVAFFIIKARTKQVRVRALERVEFKLNAALERIEADIESARNESNYERLKELMKERQQYEFAKVKLVELKKDMYKKESAKYATFDRDLTLSPRERAKRLMNDGQKDDYDFN